MSIDIELLDTQSSQNILIVEDDAPDMAFVRKKITDLWPNCKITSVESVRDAYDACNNKKFDMILLDLNLPDGFGPRTVEDIRRIEKTIPIIVITGIITPQTIDEALKLGATEVISKASIGNSDFIEILEKNRRK